VVVLGGLVVLMAYDLVLSVPPPISLHWSWADVAGMVTFSILVTLGVLAGLVLFAAHLADRCRLTRRHVVFVAVVFAFAVPAAFVAHALTGLHEVKLGHRQRASLFGAPFPWQVTVAYVTWKTPLPGIPRRSGCLLYLGSSGNTVQLYDPNPRARRTIRFPAPDVIVEFQPERTSC
jgi:hypothetical protein